MTKNISEEELLLRKRARRRLVGAIVLVIFSIILLPIIFDEPKHKIAPQEIAINLPARDKGNKNDLTSSTKDELMIYGADTSSEQSKYKASQQDIDDFIDNLNAKKSIPTPGTKPKIDNSSFIEAKSVNTSATTTAGATNNVVTSADSSKGFVIQLGAFSDQSKATQQVENLMASGFKAYMEVVKTPGKAEVTRVRVGSFITRDAADNELKKLKKLGYEGVISSR